MPEPWKRFLTLYSIQFLQLLDFISITPTGALFVSEKTLESSTISFSLAAYSVSAIAASIVLTRLNISRPKTTLIWLLSLFAISQVVLVLEVATLTFIVSRVLGGLTGGIMGAISYSQLSNIENQNSGVWNGRIQTAQSMVTLIGIPVCLLTISHFGARIYFGGIIVLTLLTAIQLASASFLKPMQVSVVKQASSKAHTWKHFDIIFTGFFCYFAAFLFMSHLPNHLLNDLQVSSSHLSLGYSISGVFTLLLSGSIGKLGDRYDAKKLLLLFSILLIGSQLLFKLFDVPAVVAFCLLPLYLVLSTGRAIHQRGIILQKKGEDIVALHLINNIAIRSGILLSGLFLGVLTAFNSDVHAVFGLANSVSVLCGVIVVVNMVYLILKRKTIVAD